MAEQRTRILGLLADGKITADEADRLLDALQGAGPEPAPAPARTPFDDMPERVPGQMPKYLYVKVVSTDGDNVDVKIPLSLVRSGIKLTSLIPPQAMEQINDSMSEHGMSFDLQNLTKDDLEELIEGLYEMEVNVDSANGDNVRVFCA